MNKSEKLSLLRQAFTGQQESLQRIRRERKQKAMPFLEVHGIVDIRTCDPRLLEVGVHSSHDAIDSGQMPDEIPLREYLCLLNAEEPGQRKYYGDAYAFLDPQDSHLDDVPICFIHIKYPDYHTRYLQGGKIATLRQAFQHSSEAWVIHPFLVLVFQCNTDELDYLLREIATLRANKSENHSAPNKNNLQQ